MSAKIEHAGSPIRIESVNVGGWTFRNGQPEDEAATLDVLRQSFRRWPPWPTEHGPVGLLRWYAEGPGPESGGWIVADDGSEITAVGLGFLRPVRLAGRTVSGVQEGYIAVHPNHRGRGGIRMYAALSRQPMVDIIWGFTQVESLVRIRSRDRSVQPSNRLSVYARILNPLSAWRDRRSLSLRHLPGYGFAAARGHLQARRVDVHPDWTILTGLPFDARVDAFFERAAEPFDFIPERSAPYLNWRYRDRRAGHFLTLTAEREDKLLGYAAVRMINSRAHLADLLVLPDRLDVATSLVERAVTMAAREGASGVECTLPRRHPYTQVLQALGFVRLAARSAEIATKFGLRNVRADAHDFGVLANPEARLHVVEADSDLI